MKLTNGKIISFDDGDGDAAHKQYRRSLAECIVILGLSNNFIVLADTPDGKVFLRSSIFKKNNHIFIQALKDLIIQMEGENEDRKKVKKS